MVGGWYFSQTLPFKHDFVNRIFLYGFLVKLKVAFHKVVSSANCFHILCFVQLSLHKLYIPGYQKTLTCVYISYMSAYSLSHRRSFIASSSMFYL